MTHAVTRIISFLILAFFLALGKVSIMIFCCVLTAAVFIIDPPQDFSKILRSIIRMKWFFLSILIVYLFINHTNTDLTTQLIEGFKRILILVMMMLLVSWLINKTPRDQILSAIIYLLSPLKYFGFSTETMALRIELIFQNIGDVQTLVTQKKESLQQRKKTVNEIGKSVSGIYFDMLDAIDEKPLDQITVKLQNPASFSDWLLPILLFSILFLIQYSS